MANKYIRHGATYNGDGTTSAAAASDGGVGAWNSLNVFEGTAPAFGSLGAGDVVYIRSKNEAGADISTTMTALRNIGSTAATATSPITWIIDNGAVWPGIDGTITYTAATVWALALRDYNNLVCQTLGSLVSQATGTSVSDNKSLFELGEASYVRGVKAAYPNNTDQYSRVRAFLLKNGCVLDSPIVKAGRLSNSLESYGGIFSSYAKSGTATVLNPDVELLDASVYGTGLTVIEDNYYFMLTIIGGRTYGAGAVSGNHIIGWAGSTPRSAVRLVGHQFPRSMDVVRGGGLGFSSQLSPARIEVFGCDDGLGGHLEELWGYATSRSDNNPPTLSATLPNAAATPWAWRVYPRNAGNPSAARLPLTRLYTDTAATRTLTLEVLVPDSLVPTKESMWLTIEYTDNATGLPKSITTRDFAAGALDTSSAAWTFTSWGLTTLLKRKIEIVTPTAIKPDTMIHAVLWWRNKAVTALDVAFVNPELGVA